LYEELDLQEQLNENTVSKNWIEHSDRMTDEKEYRNRVYNIIRNRGRLWRRWNEYVKSEQAGWISYHEAKTNIVHL
jgi:hypothetical protein